MIKNYFATTLRYDVHSLNEHPDIEVLSNTGKLKPYYDGYERLYKVKYSFHGITFITTYYVDSDFYTTEVPSQYEAKGEFLGKSEAHSLLQEVERAGKRFEQLAFRTYIQWLCREGFSSPYSLRNVCVLEQDLAKKVAKVSIDGIKAVIAFRFNTPASRYRMRVAHGGTVYKLDFRSLPALGVKMRKTFADIAIKKALPY